MGPDHRMAPDRGAVFEVPAAAVLLLWPALWNGYPIVFADTGTYLSQAIHLYAGWDRPIFYSLFMLPLHATVTVWPVVVAQALLTAGVLWLVCRVLAPGLSGFAFVGGVAALSGCTWLPWLVCELMPDLFTPLLVLLVGLLAGMPTLLSRREQVVLVGLAAFMIASQQSSVPLACVLLAALLVLPRGDGARPGMAGARLIGITARGVQSRIRRPNLALSIMAGPDPIGIRISDGRRSIRWPHRALTVMAGLVRAIGERTVGARMASTRPAMTEKENAFQSPSLILMPMGSGLAMTEKDDGSSPAGRFRNANGRAPRRGWLLIVLPPALAVFGLCVLNLAAHGRFAISPFGNIFLLARVIYDGPGMTVLRRDCPTAHWRLCPFIDAFPPTSDDFLWAPDSPLIRAGGPKSVSGDAGSIIVAALIAQPAAEARAALTNTLEQLIRFASGDGLTPWPIQVSPWIERDFPARERAAYAAARQQAEGLTVPRVLAHIHAIAAVSGVIACVILLPIALKRRAACAGFLLAVLLALPVGAAITGALSSPHDRYQARNMWLPPFIAVVSLASLRRRHG